ncbi:hypothetical protein TWF694_003769 [Orbilia ellipsospora]|uniref:Uncharacterized protein n=1 Tax=Orbilia ellipsospora TaxID=2528407 RepID=A0AAV9X1P3_9PEZI
MDSAKYNHAKSILELAGATAAVLGIIWGIWTAAWEINRRRATRHLGILLQLRHEMGAFTPQFASRFRILWPFWLSEVQIPQVPTIGGIIKAGDEQIYSAAMFENIEPENGAVSWKPLYTKFMEELAWNSLVYRDSPTENRIPENLARYCNHALNNIQKILRPLLKHHHHHTSYHSNHSSYWKFLNIFTHIAELLTKFVSSSLFSYFKFRFLSPPFELCIGEDDAKSLDRHLLYAPWKLCASGHLSGGLDYKSFLINCVKPLEYLDHGANVDDQSSKRKPWFKYTKRIWILDGKPNIEVLEEEFAAFVLIMGLEANTKGQHRSSEQSAFGVTIGLESTTAVDKVRLLYRSLGWEKEPGKGSGWSILMAKHMACSCLPFLQTRDGKASAGTIETIPINRYMLEHIELGHSIIDQRNEAWGSSSAISYLYRLPSSKSPNFYKGVLAEQYRGMGTIYDRNNPPVAVSSWSKAVAGVAFGGLVPVAGYTLVKSIKFTLEGGQPRDRVYATLSEIIDVIHKQARKDLPGISLFGKRIDITSERLERGFVVRFDPSSRIRYIAWRLGVYSTLLERLVAIYQPTCGTSAEHRLSDVYKRCCDVIQIRYDEAVQAKQKMNQGQEQKASTINNSSQSETAGCSSIQFKERSDSQLEGVLFHLKQGKILTVDHVAIVALAIIHEWAHLVKVIDWEKSPSGDRDMDLGSGQFKDTSFQHLPDISAWS